MKKRVLIINTGGTIGMEPASVGYRPAPGFLADQMSRISELSDPSMPEYAIEEYDPILDSSNFTPSHWLRIATDVASRYEDFDAFLILHGTDTMAYSSSALAMMLRGLSKNVILTGAQLPLCMRRNDARENLITALILASEYSLPEVTLYFGSRLLRGCRATKVSTNSFDAFDSPNEPPLGTVGTNIRVFEHRVRRPPQGAELHIDPIRAANMATFRLFPGVEVDVLHNVLQTPLQGLLLETYGAGNGPSRDKRFLQVLSDACDRDIVIVNISQCWQGSVSPDEYETGKALSDAGVVPGGDMTIEAAIAKLMWLFSRELPTDLIRTRMTENLFGELTS